MRKMIFHILFAGVLLLCMPIKAQEQKFDWRKINSSDYSIKDALVKYDSSSKEAIDKGRRSFTLNEKCKTIPPLNISVLLDFLSDSLNFISPEKKPSCKFAILDHALVIFYKNKPIANIHFGLKNTYWIFEPAFEGKTALIVSSIGEKKLKGILP